MWTPHSGRVEAHLFINPSDPVHSVSLYGINLVLPACGGKETRIIPNFVTKKNEQLPPCYAASSRGIFYYDEAMKSHFSSRTISQAYIFLYNARRNWPRTTVEVASISLDIPCRWMFFLSWTHGWLEDGEQQTHDLLYMHSGCPWISTINISNPHGRPNEHLAVLMPVPDSPDG